jgi:hypothetical protein
MKRLKNKFKKPNQLLISSSSLSQETFATAAAQFYHDTLRIEYARDHERRLRQREEDREQMQEEERRSRSR